MAVIKQVKRYGGHYGNSVEYLMFQHNEKTGAVLRDANGNKMLRGEYYLDGILCNPMSYPSECRKLNEKYHKNLRKHDLTEQHYILSFDPKDAKDHGLTGERAQQLGLEFAKKCFPGFQTLVCTHTDGHNGSGNIHCHIIFNTVRKKDVPLLPFMKYERDGKAGYKYHPTKEYLLFLREEVMKLCERENLYQVDLKKSPSVRITNEEYRVRQNGQKNLDQINQEIREEGLTPRKTVFQTQKQKIRDAVYAVMETAATVDEFKNRMMRDYGIWVKETRGRFSYLPNDRQKPISERQLGTDFEKENIEERIRQRNTEKGRGEDHDFLKENASVEKTELSDKSKKTDHGKEDIFIREREMQEWDPDYDYRKDPIAVLFIRTEIRLVIHLQDYMKQEYGNWKRKQMQIENIHQMAETILYVQKKGFHSVKEMEERLLQIKERMEEPDSRLDQLNSQKDKVDEKMKALKTYFRTKAVYGEMLKSENKAVFRMEHLKEIQKYENARIVLRTGSMDGEFPKEQQLWDERLRLQGEIHKLQEEQKTLKDELKELETVKKNVESILEKKPILISAEKQKSQNIVIS